MAACAIEKIKSVFKKLEFCGSLMFTCILMENGKIFYSSDGYCIYIWLVINYKFLKKLSLIRNFEQESVYVADALVYACQYRRQLSGFDVHILLTLTVLKR